MPTTGLESAASSQIAPELPLEVFEAWHKPDRAINPIAIVATTDPDGAPHTAPFGSLRAMTPQVLRLATARYHQTYLNLCRDPRVTVALLSPPNIAVSVRGHARVVKEEMTAYHQGAVIDIDIEEVKNDMVRSLVIETPVSISPRPLLRSWFKGVMGELEEI